MIHHRTQITGRLMMNVLKVPFYDYFAVPKDLIARSNVKTDHPSASVLT
jgi:hypothetical protein